MRDRWVAARREEGRRRLRILVIVASVITVLALAWGVTVSPLLAIEQIDVKGNAQVTTAEVIAAAQVGEGDAMVWLDPDQVAARLEASPWIRTAKVTRDWPRTLVIEVTERTPAAWVQVDGAAGVLVVDGTGRVLTRADAPPAGLPQIVDVQGAEPGGSIVPARGAAVAAAYGMYASAVCADLGDRRGSGGQAGERARGAPGPSPRSCAPSCARRARCSSRCRRRCRVRRRLRAHQPGRRLRRGRLRARTGSPANVDQRCL